MQARYASRGVTNVTNLAGEEKRFCGTMDRHGMGMMRVFTTIFLEETLRANIECVEEAMGIDQNHPGAVEFKETLRAYLSRLERSESSGAHDKLPKLNQP